MQKLTKVQDHFQLHLEIKKTVHYKGQTINNENHLNAPSIVKEKKQSIKILIKVVLKGRSKYTVHTLLIQLV